MLTIDRENSIFVRLVSGDFMALFDIKTLPETTTKELKRELLNKSDSFKRNYIKSERMINGLIMPRNSQKLDMTLLIALELEQNNNSDFSKIINNLYNFDLSERPVRFLKEFCKISNYIKNFLEETKPTDRRQLTIMRNFAASRKKEEENELPSISAAPPKERGKK